MKPRDKIFYRSQSYYITAEPLRGYLELLDFEFESPMPDMLRGCYGSWELDDSKLYLVGFKGFIRGDGRNSVLNSALAEHQRAGRFTNLSAELNEVDMSFLFPDQTKVFADWFTVRIEIKMNQAMLMNFDKANEETTVVKLDKILKFKNGELISESEMEYIAKMGMDEYLEYV